MKPLKNYSFRFFPILPLFAAVILFMHFFSWKSFTDLSFLSFWRDPDFCPNFPQSMQNLKAFLGTCFCVLVALTVVWRWGRQLYVWFGWAEENTALRFCQEMACGFVFFQMVWLGLGLERLWRERFILALGLFFLGWVLWDLRLFGKEVQRFPKWAPQDRMVWVIATLALIVFSLSLLQAFAPETYYDALVYHLSALDLWRYQNGLSDDPTNLYSYYPFGGEFGLLNVYWFGGSEAAKLLNSAVEGLAALAVAGWVAKKSGSSWGWTAGALMIFCPVLTASVWSCQTDVFLVLFFLLFVFTLSDWKSEPDSRRWGPQTGLWAGAAMTVKYTALFYIPVALLVLGAIQPAAMGRKRLVGWGWMIVVSLFLFIPWLLKNFIYTGDPFYPYFLHLLGGQPFPEASLQALMEDHEAALKPGVTFFSWFHQVLTRDLDRTIAPLLFSFVPFLFLKTLWKPNVRFMMILAAIATGGGLLLSHQLRLLLPALAVFFAASCSFFPQVKMHEASKLWMGFVLLFGLWSLVTLTRLSFQYQKIQQLWFGCQDRTTYLSKLPSTRSYFDLTLASGAFLPPTDRLLVVGDARGLYYPRMAYANSVFDPQVIPDEARAARDPQEFWSALHKRGVDDLVVSGEEGSRVFKGSKAYELTDPQWVLVDGLIQHYTDLVYLKGSNAIYRLRPINAGSRKPIPDLLLLFRGS